MKKMMTIISTLVLATIATMGTLQAAPDWSKAPAKKMTLLYPGTASLEWTLKGVDHSGAKAMKGGETCAGCHDKEAADVGKKIVSGGKPDLEKTAIKVPGSIPITVQATHDGANLYLRLQWKDTKSTGAPKMDEKNQVKVAMMIDAGKVDYADVGGCWASCHHDLRTMPDVDKNAPNHAKAKALDIRKNGPTKYLKESRTSITNKEHPWGGWDKLKSGAEIDKELKEGEFLDIVQYRSGAAPRDGYVLDARRMKEVEGVAEGKLEGDTWTVSFTRKLASAEIGDHKIEPGKTYHIGFAIHDAYSNERHHHVSLGHSLALDNAKADINAVKQ
ncbi:MAG: ethylbenzene dehydrogenase-related protein [Sulfuricaulis sp.]|uniref:ethylbenzene dehydrogenase-related protein n=1 Tax=Sulfuricaulis sp. TaxID=2003553 RepID=UPI0025F2E1E3|nr:ethylbenzene dehydrogenase-related protein [Sulfuricaulis sp.]MCR4346683.1 ethylbenzene dehydrogenase-related protein [Sulfuricaulis sp.]